MTALPLADRLIVGLDVPGLDEARAVVDALGDLVTFYKVGMQLQFVGGLAFAQELARSGKKVFLDVKLLDIDNTVAHGVEGIAAMGMTFCTIHAYPKAMRAAVAGRGPAPLRLLGVTVLTSMDDADLAAAGYGRTAADLVVARARDAAAAGMDGIVCSVAEVAAVRAAVGPDLALVTPGIRPAGAAAGDQRRVATPAEAIRAGADHLVVARPILAATDRRAAADAILEEIDGAL